MTTLWISQNFSNTILNFIGQGWMGCTAQGQSSHGWGRVCWNEMYLFNQTFQVSMEMQWQGEKLYLKSIWFIIHEPIFDHDHGQTISTLRCQINESTRLAFLDFFPPLLVYLALLVFIFHPTRLANFPLYSFFWS